MHVHNAMQVVSVDGSFDVNHLNPMAPVRPASTMQKVNN